MEQIVIACKKIREAARLLAAANERTLAEKQKPLRSRWTARMSNNPHARTLGSPAPRRGFLFFRFGLHPHAPPCCQPFVRAHQHCEVWRIASRDKIEGSRRTS